jgi:hypothetical protein
LLLILQLLFGNSPIALLCKLIMIAKYRCHHQW